jgi:hypothetical protein
MKRHRDLQLDRVLRPPNRNPPFQICVALERTLRLFQRKWRDLHVKVQTNLRLPRKKAEPICEPATKDIRPFLGVAIIGPKSTVCRFSLAIHSNWGQRAGPSSV